MTTVPTPDFVSERYTDVGNARRLVAAHGQDLRYVPQWGTWLVWDGRCWRRDHAGQVVERAKQVAHDLFDAARRIPDDKARTEAMRWAFQSESAQRLAAMISLARSEKGIPVDPDALDRKQWLLNVENGTLDLRCGELRPSSRSDLLTRVAPVAYDAEATADRWHAFLAHVLPDVELREFVARWCGYCLTGDISEHKLIEAVGSGENGKGTLFGTFQRMLGDYAGEAAPDLLLRRRDEPHPTGLADLHGKRLVLTSETGEDRKLDEPLLKRLTGGDRIKARQMHKDFFEFEPTHKFIISTNHAPRVDGTDRGIWRRLRLVPFDVTIGDDEKDPHLAEKLLDEAPGILRWAVEGCLRWQRGGLTEPTAVIARTAEYRAANDVFGSFVSDCCLLAPGVSVRSAALLGAYQRWAEATGEPAMNQRQLGLRLRERGLTKRASNGVWWDGIALKLEPSSGDGVRESAGQTW